MKRLDKLKRHDVVTFDEDDKVVVLARFDYDGRKFVYVNEILSDESSTTDIYKIMEIHLEDDTLEKVTDPGLLNNIYPIAQKMLAGHNKREVKTKNSINSIDSSTYNYFYNLIDKLAKWVKKEEYCSLDVYGISVIKDFERSNENIKRMLIIGNLGDSECDIDMFLNIPNCHPSDQKFRDEVYEWFNIGRPWASSSYALYQSIGSFRSDVDLKIAMQFLQRDVKRKYPDVSISFHMPETSSTGACYIATAVYGSYNCPEVWTLRRFRDNVLSKSAFGRWFIKAYYFISPKLVDAFGNNSTFKKVFRNLLDKLVKNLNDKGIKNTYYNDK